jgi:hypothetical protein
MSTTNEKLRNVAEVAAKIMIGEKLHPNQQKLDVHEPEKDELTAKDFEMLRAGKKAKEVKKEEVEQIQEYESKDGKFVHRAKPGVYGGTKDEKHAVDTLKGPKMKELSDIEAEKKKKKKMSEMIATYEQQGLKGLFEALKKDEVIVEEPDNETFTKEVEAQKAKNAGEGKKAEVAKPAVQAVQNEETHTKVEVLDFNDVNGVKRSEIDLEERHLTEPEMKEKERLVKSMKKGISGFKERYGSRAKEVMYATATARAKGE